MATVSSAGGGSSMSNAQAGTRGLSSSDLTRLKKLNLIGKAGWNTKDSGTSTNQTLYSTPMLIPKTTGSSKIRNTGSDWTSYKAYLTSDQITQKQAVAGQTGVVLSVTKLCNACGINPPYSANKTGICVSCVYNPKWRNQ